MPISPEQLVPLIDRYWAVLVHWVGTSELDAEDIVQVAFVKLAALEPPPQDCVAWLFAVARRLAINSHLSKSRRKKHEMQAVQQAYDRCRAGQTLEAAELREQLDKLESPEREVVVAHIWGQLTFDQIAEATGSSKATAWRAYQAAIKKLQSYYGDI